MVAHGRVHGWCFQERNRKFPPLPISGPPSPSYFRAAFASFSGYDSPNSSRFWTRHFCVTLWRPRGITPVIVDQHQLPPCAGSFRHSQEPPALAAVSHNLAVYKSSPMSPNFPEVLASSTKC